MALREDSTLVGVFSPRKVAFFASITTATIQHLSFILHYVAVVVRRVTTLPGKSWNLVRPFSRPGKSRKTAKVMESRGK